MYTMLPEARSNKRMIQMLMYVISPATQLFVQKFIQANNNKTTKALA